MSLYEYLNRQTPDYYPTMHLDGYTPEEILQAHRKMMLDKIAGSQMVDTIKIISEVKTK